jgi:hypothetical protein
MYDVLLPRCCAMVCRCFVIIFARYTTHFKSVRVLYDAATLLSDPTPMPCDHMPILCDPMPMLCDAVSMMREGTYEDERAMVLLVALHEGDKTTLPLVHYIPIRLVHRTHLQVQTKILCHVLNIVMVCSHVEQAKRQEGTSIRYDTWRTHVYHLVTLNGLQ